MIDFSTFSPSNFSRYISQSEELPEETIDIDEWGSTGFTSVSEIPPLMSIQTSDFVVPAGQEASISMNFLPMNVSERVEPIPIPHHGPGPIQRPNKLATSTVPTAGLANMNNSLLSANSPDVLEQINQLIYEPNSPVEGPSITNANHSSSNTSMMNDLTSPTINWAPFAASEWRNKNEPTWFLPSMSTSSPIQINAATQNPFTLLHPMNDRQRQISPNESNLWAPIMNSAGARFTAPGNRPQHPRQWEDVFSSASPSTDDLNKPNSNTWSKMWPVADSPQTNVSLIHGRHAAPTNAPWSFNDLPTDSVVPTSNRSQGSRRSPNWWPNPLADENNNKNASNHDNSQNRDQSRWDFAR